MVPRLGVQGSNPSGRGDAGGKCEGSGDIAGDSLGVIGTCRATSGGDDECTKGDAGGAGIGNKLVRV